MMRLSLWITLFLALAAPAAAELNIEVNVADRQLLVHENGSVIGEYEVSVGKEKNPTPTGNFTIGKIIWNPSWRPPDEKWARGKTAKPPGHPDNPMKRVKIFFKEPDYYIHGTAETESLGRAGSHGCIRMDEEDVTELAKLLMEHGGKPQPEPWYRRILRRRTTKVVLLANKIPIEIRP
jgi:lipoprotein-anchoring transpeptidase ErfK/SrfK